MCRCKPAAAVLAKAPSPNAIALTPGSHTFSSSASWLEDDLDAAVLFFTKRFIHGRSLFEWHRVRDDKGRIDLPFLNAAQKIVCPPVDMRLAHLPGETFIHRGAERDPVETIHADNAPPGKFEDEIDIPQEAKPAKKK